jgi:very-short-patch-repair endonuclease
MPKKGQSIYTKLNDCAFLRQKYLVEMSTAAQISKEVGCKSLAVFNALHRCDIPVHSFHPELHNPSFLRQLYWEKELTKAQLAEIIGCKYVALSNAFKRYGIRTRTKSECSAGKNNSRYGVLCSQETKQRISEATSGEKHHHFGRTFTKEHKRRIGLAHKNPNEETRRRLSKASSGKKNGMYGKHPSEETRQKLRKHGLKQWRNPAYVKKVIAGWNNTPNKTEILMDIILQKLAPHTFAYNGDFRCNVSIGRKIPDFINITGQKLVIEVFGPWHDEQHMAQYYNSKVSWARTEWGTKATYSQCGYGCIVFWERDLKHKDAETFVLNELKRNNVL